MEYFGKIALIGKTAFGGYFGQAFLISSQELAGAAYAVE